MSATEITILAAIIYSVIGAMSALCAAAADSPVRLILISFLLWPLIAYYGLRLIVERAKTWFRHST